MTWWKHTSFLIGVACYTVVMALHFAGALGYGFPIVFIQIGLLGTVFFHLLFFWQTENQRSFSDVEKLFVISTQVGVVCLLISLIPNFFKKWVDSYHLNMLGELLGFYAFMYFSLFLLINFKKLMTLNERDNSLDLQWKGLLTILSISTLTYLYPYVPGLLVILIGIAGALLTLPFLLRIKWLVSINLQLKWLGVLFMAVLAFILFGMIQNIVHYNLVYVLVQPLYYNVFFGILLFFLSAYGVFAFLALLFNMPLASINEQRSKEIRSMQEISRSVTSKIPIEETFTLLFQKCFSDTSSDAGWLMIGNDLANEAKIIHSDKIPKESINFYLEKTNLAETLKKDLTAKHYYFSDIANIFDANNGQAEQNLFLRESEKGFFSNFTINKGSNAAIDTINNNIPSRFRKEKDIDQAIAQNDLEKNRYNTLLVLPVYTDENLQGNICLLKKIVNGFDLYEIELAKNYVAQAHLAFENAALVKSTIEAERAKQELDIARTAQKQLLPLDFPESEFFELSAFSESAMEVGGDYYDFMILDNNRLALIVADVAGSGTSAAFYMAHLKGVFQSLVQLKLPVRSFLEFANAALSHCLEKRVFITLTYTLFDFSRKKLLYGRAGHTPILYYSAEEDTFAYMEDEGLGMGIIRDGSYSKFVKTYEQRFNSGDIFVLFTDGIIESRNPQTKEEYGTVRLKKCLENHSDTSAEMIKKLILQDWYKYIGQSIENIDSGRFPDDHTIIVLKIK